MNPETDRQEFEKTFKIMVVEDELVFVQSIDMYLKRRGLNVTCLSDSNEALRLLKSERFDILISDLKMPGLDGISLATAARELHPEISILLMTAYGSMQEAVQAVRDHTGLILSAHGGTLFLDEIAEIPPELQVKLLGVLQEKTVRPVGGKSEVPVDIRIMTASNRPLKEALKSGRVREDFYYRIRVLPIWIPPLRERKEDIPVVIGHTLKKLHAAGKSRVKSIAPGAMNIMLSYDWPGNVRELENLLERCAAVGSRQDRIEVRDLPVELVEAARPGAAGDSPLNLTDLEIGAIKKALIRTAGNKTLAAELLGIDKSTLHRKIRRYRLE